MLLAGIRIHNNRDFFGGGGVRGFLWVGLWEVKIFRVWIMGLTLVCQASFSSSKYFFHFVFSTGEEAEWILSEESSILEASTTSFVAMRIYEASTLIAFGISVVIVVWRGKRLECLMESYLKMRTVAERFGWDLGSGLLELVLFLILNLTIDGATWVLWQPYWRNGWVRSLLSCDDFHQKIYTYI